MKHRCNLKFEFDKQDRKYLAGDMVSGHLVVQALQAFEIKAVHMRLRWRAYASNGTSIQKDALVSSKQDNADTIKLELTETVFKEGETYRIPFSFVAPVGPLTYSGINLKINWSLDANLDLPKLPGFTELKASAKLHLRAKEGQAVYLGPNYKKPAKVEPFLQGGNYFYPIFTVLITAGILWYLSSGSNPVQNRVDVITFWLVLVIGALIAIGQLIFFFMEQEMAATLKTLEFKLDSQKVMPGEALNYHFVLEPKKDVSIKKLQLNFKGTELASTRGDHKTNKTAKEVLHEQKLELASSQAIAANTVFEKTGRIMLPASAAYTFVAERGGSSDRNITSVTYELEFELVFNNGTSTRRRYQIDVLPWVD